MVGMSLVNMVWYFKVQTSILGDTITTPALIFFSRPIPQEVRRGGSLDWYAVKNIYAGIVLIANCHYS